MPRSGCWKRDIRLFSGETERILARHLLGSVLIKAGKAADAEVVYRGDLSRHPNNGWALCGRAQSLKL